MIINNSLTLDLSRRHPTPRIDAVQNDANSRIVEISLTENGTEWQIPETAAPAVFFSKPDGTAGIYDVLPDGNRAIVISGNSLAFTLAPQMLTAPGLVRASVALIQDSAQLATFPLDILVEAMPGAGGETSEDYYRYTTFEEINNAIGDLDMLRTEDKSSLVAAINEILRKGGTGTVRSVNGIEPDEAGNVALEVPEGFSGSWNDLTDKPVIPEEVTDDHINSLIDAKLGVIENGAY